MNSGDVTFGAGVDTSIDRASFKALLSAMNRAVEGSFPPGTVRVASFSICHSEVSIGEYGEFLRATGYVTSFERRHRIPFRRTMGTDLLPWTVNMPVSRVSFDDAIAHIERYGSEHTETIVTASYQKSREFVERVNSSAVLVNASTRFNDGGELGLGAEIGISTSKIHAFGPMGLEELTITKFIVFGDGQIRE